MNRFRLIVLSGLGAALTLGACGHNAGKAAGGSGALGAGPSGAPASASAGTGNLGAGPAPSGAAGATRPAGPSGPQIVYFKVTGKPRCPVVGTSDAPFSAPAEPVVLAWQVTGASGVALSIDDPGFYNAHHSGGYGSYGAQASVSLSFPCGDITKQQTTHTYTINTLGDGSRAKTLTVTVPTRP